MRPRGRRRRPESSSRTLRQRSEQRYVSPYGLAVLYTGLGEKDQALSHLRKACVERAGDAGEVAVDPFSDPRFAEILRYLSLGN